MKRKMFCLVLLVGLLVSGSMTAYATGDTGDKTGNWQVTFTAAGKMEDNLGDDVNDKLAAMQPGDEIKASVTLTNANSGSTDWYMKNNVVKSMEKTLAGTATEANGGAYSYKLTYYPPVGDPTVLYTSEKVGGDNNNGLWDLETDEKLSEYFYLGNLASGQSARVELTVGLDGETQGNSYQLQAANLSMNFAAELRPQSSGGGGGGRTHHRTITREVVNNEVVYVDEDGVPLARTTDIVKTSDEMNLFPYVLAACISGSILLIFALFSMKNKKKEEEGGAVE